MTGPPACRPVCLIVRTEPGAGRTAAAVAALGWRPVVCPARQVVAVEAGAAAPATGLASGPVLLTSAHAATHAPAQLVRRQALCVGAATAEAARRLGFYPVADAGGDQSALVRLVRETVPVGTTLVWLRGNEVAGDLTALLAPGGYSVVEQVVYRTEDRPDFAAAVRAALAGGPPGAVLIHSPAGARALAAALAGGTAPPDLSGWQLAAISQAAAAPLQQAGFASVRVAPEPTGAAVLAALGPAAG